MYMSKGLFKIAKFKTNKELWCKFAAFDNIFLMFYSTSFIYTKMVLI